MDTHPHAAGANARRVAALFDADDLPAPRRQILRSIVRHARTAGWHLALDPRALHRKPGAWDGAIGLTALATAQLIRRARTPVVSVDWSHEHLPLPRAAANRHEAGRLAASHLVQRGYRTFAYVGFSQGRASRLERDSFQKELGRLGRHWTTARFARSYRRTERRQQSVMRQLTKWLDGLAPPAGLFVARPGMARTLADAAIARGTRVPEDLGIIAADDEPLACELPPALTSIRYDYAEVGRRGAQLLDRLMHGQEPPPRAELVPPLLIPRESTDRQRTGEPLVARALDWIDARRTEPIRAPHVARALGIGLRRLQRAFRDAGRDTIQDEIRRARIAHAKLLLRDPRQTLRTAAHEAGFSSYRALLRAFKRFVGTLPSHWRHEEKSHPADTDRAVRRQLPRGGGTRRRR